MTDLGVIKRKTIELKVPFVTQLAIGGSDYDNVWDDPMGCWYACVCMVGFFFEQGPRHGLPELFTIKFKNHYGHQRLIKTDDHHLLMAREGLELIPESDQVHHYTAKQIQHLLAVSGPILFCWNKYRPQRARPFGHTSVLIGCNGNELRYHDPQNHDNRQNGGENLQMTIDSFNAQRLFKPGVYGLLRKAQMH